MPIYEFLCPSCNQVFEVMRPFSKAEEPAVCPRCGAQGQKLISIFASKIGFYLGVPEKEAFRELPRKQMAKPKRQTTKRATTKKRKSTT